MLKIFKKRKKQSPPSAAVNTAEKRSEELLELLYKVESYK